MADDAGLRMPEALMARARELIGKQQAGWLPPPARDAATVVMVANHPDGIHIYLQRRVRTMAFAAGMYVFPGGATEGQDAAMADALLAANPERQLDASWLVKGEASVGTDTLTARCAAVRETEEETSYDLGDPRDLTYIAHWVTPEVEQRRFDTRFYAQVVHAPDEVIENSGESDAERWVSPGEALAEYGGGRMAMLPPTVAVLSEFAAAADKGLDAQAAVDAVALTPTLPLMPAPVADPTAPDGMRWVLIDVRTGEEVTLLPSAPAGSEAGGVHTSTASNLADAHERVIPDSPDTPT
ncbi:MAG: NUDIX hydrolase [Candidatus Nanopelagicales bacterium]